MFVMFAEKRPGSTHTMAAKFVPPAGHFSEDQSSPSIMKYLNARKTKTAKLILKQERIVNFAGKQE